MSYLLIFYLNFALLLNIGIILLLGIHSSYITCILNESFDTCCYGEYHEKVKLKGDGEKKTGWKSMETEVKRRMTTTAVDTLHDDYEKQKSQGAISGLLKNPPQDKNKNCIVTMKLQLFSS